MNLNELVETLTALVAEGAGQTLVMVMDTDTNEMYVPKDVVWENDDNATSHTIWIFTEPY